MGKNGYWIIRTYESGPVGEKIKFWVPGERPTRSQRKMKQDLRKARQNKEASERELARVINANFGPGDVLLGLDWNDESYEAVLERRAEKIRVKRAGEDCDEERMECRRQAGQHELMNYILRVQRACKKRNIPFRYIAVTSDMDGKSGELVRVHHHLIINREALDVAKEKWNYGGVDYKRLGRQPDYTPIAAYLMAQVRHVPDAKKYTPSRNLIRPQPKDRAAMSDAELRVPKGCAVLHRSEYRPGMNQYIRYILRSRKPQKRKSAS